MKIVKSESSALTDIVDWFRDNKLSTKSRPKPSTNFRTPNISKVYLQCEIFRRFRHDRKFSFSGEKRKIMWKEKKNYSRRGKLIVKMCTVVCDRRLCASLLRRWLWKKRENTFPTNTFAFKWKIFEWIFFDLLCLRESFFWFGKFSHLFVRRAVDSLADKRRQSLI